MGEYSKMWVAIFGAMLASAQTAVPMPPLWHGILTVLITGTTAFTVYKVENKPVAAAGARRWPGDDAKAP